MSIREGIDCEVGRAKIARWGGQRLSVGEGITFWMLRLIKAMVPEFEWFNYTYNSEYFQGESGSPLLSPKAGKMWLEGLLSQGWSSYSGCKLTGLPSVFSSVVRQSSWVVRVTGMRRGQEKDHDMGVPDLI